MKKRYIIYGLLAIITVVGLFWLSGHSYVRIIVDNPAGSGSLDYSITNQVVNKPTITKGGPPSLKRLVSKGDYQATVTQNDSSAFSVIGAGGFLTTKTVHVNLVAQKGRTFVGDNPGICGAYTGKLLLSFECHGRFTDTLVHTQATATTPSIAQKIKAAGVSGTTESIVQTTGGAVALVRGPEYADSSSDIKAPLTLYRLTPDATVAEAAPIPNLADSTPYTLVPYKDGFILHNTDLTQVFYFSSVASKPTEIKAVAAKDKQLSPVAFDARNDSFLGVYTKEGNDNASDTGSDKEPAKSANYRFVITTNGKSKEYGYTGNVSAIKFCGQNLLCILDQDKVNVYSFNGKLKYLYRVTSAQGMVPLGDKVIVATDFGTLNLDPNKRSGYYDVLFGEYKYCGLNPGVTTYSLCMLDRKSNRVAFFVDPAQPNTDSIDQKISRLAGLIYINKVSAYQNSIFISGNFGETKYQADRKGYDYDPATKKAAIDAINQAIGQAGIDRSKYQITIL